MRVFILANCRKTELWPATELVFKSLRIGFPTADILVTHTDSGSTNESRRGVLKLCGLVGASMEDRYCEHPSWVAHYLRYVAWASEEPFYLCDTDQSFYANMENFEYGDAPLAGRYVPAFHCEFTKCLTAHRLHTSLLYVNPPRLLEALAKYKERFPQTVYTPSVDLFSPCVMPDGRFYDGAAMLYAAVGGYSFTERELECYDHVQCGCISDIVGPHIGDGKMQERHKMIFENPALLKGAWKRDHQFFKERAA